MLGYSFPCSVAIGGAINQLIPGIQPFHQPWVLNLYKPLTLSPCESQRGGGLHSGGDAPWCPQKGYLVKITPLFIFKISFLKTNTSNPNDKTCRENLRDKQQAGSYIRETLPVIMGSLYSVSDYGNNLKCFPYQNIPPMLGSASLKNTSLTLSV